MTSLNTLTQEIDGRQNDDVVKWAQHQEILISRDDVTRARTTYVYRRLGGGKSLVADGRSGHRLLERSPTPVAYPVWFAKASLQLARMRSSLSCDCQFEKLVVLGISAFP
jgi:hypothetical protein